MKSLRGGLVKTIGVDASRGFISEKTGTETYSSELIQALLKLPEAAKFNWRLYVKQPIKENFSDNVEVVVIPWKRFWTQAGLALELNRRPVDTLFIPAHTLPALRPKGIKTVVTIHGLEYEFLPEYYQFPQKLLLNRSTEYAVREADRLIAVSNWTKKQLVERLKADPKKISVIHEGVGQRFLHLKEYGLNKTLARQVRHKYSLPDKYLLFVGTIQPRKNLVRLIEAFSNISHLGSNIYLVIAGKIGWLAEEIYQAPKKFGVADRVKFLGRVADPDLPAVYSLATVFVWPSLMEGFGLPLIEAMTCGVPIITSSRGALPEVAGEAALIVDPENVSQLAEAIKLMLESPELRQALVEKGYRQSAKFNWIATAKKTIAMLK